MPMLQQGDFEMLQLLAMTPQTFKNLNFTIIWLKDFGYYEECVFLSKDPLLTYITFGFFYCNYIFGEITLLSSWKFAEIRIFQSVISRLIGEVWRNSLRRSVLLPLHHYYRLKASLFTFDFTPWSAECERNIA